MIYIKPIILLIAAIFIACAITYGSTMIAVRFQELSATIREGQACSAGVKALVENTGIKR